MYNLKAPAIWAGVGLVATGIVSATHGDWGGAVQSWFAALAAFGLHLGQQKQSAQLCKLSSRA